MTLTMFQNTFSIRSKRRTNAFIIDVCDELRDYIPNYVRRNSIELSQIVNLKENESIKEYVFNRYRMYYVLGKLVITSRLHCAIHVLPWEFGSIGCKKSFF